MEAISMEDPPGAQETQSLLQLALCLLASVADERIDGRNGMIQRHNLCDDVRQQSTAVSAGDMEAISMEDPPGAQETQSLLQRQFFLYPSNNA